MKIVVCYASPEYKSRLTDELVSAGKEYVQKYFPKGLLDIYWLNTKKQSLEKYLLKNENISAIFVPENMTDTIEVVKRHKIKIEKFGEKDTEKTHEEKVYDKVKSKMSDIHIYYPTVNNAKKIYII